MLPFGPDGNKSVQRHILMPTSRVSSVYWKEVRAEATRQIRADFHSRLRVSLTIATLAFLIACAVLHLVHVTIPITVIVGFGAAISANLIYLAWQWCSHLITIPVERDASQLSTIAEKDQQIARSEAPISPIFRGQLRELQVLSARDTPPNHMLVSAVIIVRYLGDASNMSVHQARLWLRGHDDPSKTLAGPWTIEGRFMRPTRVEFRFVSIAPEIQKARAMNTQWKFSFKDHLDKEYESDIFPPI